ncbi:EamA family transporter [Azospirillum sp. YIM B02556]|uniref:EamA family transporter n=1 Tax=Azospirillum endophyticum TaxID=2800326 RepID=A0ABS1FDH3_9PROT|nr:DMT family transporter [Azospirillum endophyticum]MBK1841486.1 EamA family transporter [Azospirillum endophyticum]
MSILEIGAALLVALLWGVQFVTSKYGVEAFPPLFFVTLRFALVALLLLPFTRRPSRREIAASALISVFFGGLCFGLFFTGLHLGAVGLSAVIVQLTAPFTVLIAWPMLGERPPARVALGLAIAFAGVALAMANPGEPMPPIAALLVAAGSAAQAFGNVLIKRLGPLEPLRLIGWLSLFTVPQVGLASWLLEWGQIAALRAADLPAWLSLGYAVLFGAILAFCLWFWLIERVSLARAGPFALLQTVFAILAAIVFLGERATMPLMIGAAICIAGVILTQSASPARPHPKPS